MPPIFTPLTNSKIIVIWHEREFFSCSIRSKIEKFKNVDFCEKSMFYFFSKLNLFLAILGHLEPLCIVLAASLKSTQDQPTISTTNNAGVRRRRRHTHSATAHTSNGLQQPQAAAHQWRSLRALGVPGRPYTAAAGRQARRRGRPPVRARAASRRACTTP